MLAAAIVLGAASAAGGRERTASTDHVLQVRWTAAAYWFDTGAKNVGEAVPLQYTTWARAGLDIVWRQPIINGAPQGFGTRGYSVKRLSAFEQVIQKANISKYACTGSWVYKDPDYYPFSSVVDGKWQGDFTAPTNERLFVAKAPPGSACYFGVTAIPCEFFAAGAGHARIRYTPHYSTPPYPAAWSAPGAACAAVKGGLLNVSPNNPNTTRSFTYEIGPFSAPVIPETIHGVWFGCASVEEDPKTPPKPIDPFTLGGYQGASSPADPKPPPDACASKPACVGPIEILKDGVPVAKTMQAVVGEKINLSVKCVKGNAPPPGPRWTIQGSTPTVQTSSTLSRYTIDNGGADAQTIPLSDLTAPQLSFHFVRQGSFKVSVKAGGLQYSTTFEVESPQLGDGPFATTCRVDLSSQILPFPPYLEITERVGPGWNDSCAFDKTVGKGRPGIAWRFPVQATTPRQAGRVALVQLITVRAHHDGKPCAGLQTSNQADVAAFYDSKSQNRSRAFVQLSPGTTALWQDRDSPFLNLNWKGLKPLLSSTIWDETFKADDYLMYKPALPGSIWVSLGNLTWNWSAVASLSGVGKPWQLVSRRDPRQFPGFASFGGPPEFKGSFSPDLPGC